VEFSTSKIPKVVGGYTPACLRQAIEVYRNIVEVVPVSSTWVAEASKILENTYRAVNIAMVNELKMLFDKMGINIWEVIEAAKTKPFGFQPFYPGPGLGGHCIPIDPFYLTWKAREYDFGTRFIELAGEINTLQPYYVVQKVVEALNLDSKSIRNSRVLILGMAYKKNVDDMRESPSLKIYELLREGGSNVCYYDPYIKDIESLRRYPDLKICSIEYSPDELHDFDLILLLTDHDIFPYEEILKNAKRIVDTRNAFPVDSEKVLKA
jgi:UDP-N-acetyl-D-glucosamine dehydrogenase